MGKNRAQREQKRREIRKKKSKGGHVLGEASMLVLDLGLENVTHQGILETGSQISIKVGSGRDLYNGQLCKVCDGDRTYEGRAIRKNGSGYYIKLGGRQ